MFTKLMAVFMIIANLLMPWAYPEKDEYFLVELQGSTIGLNEWDDEYDYTSSNTDVICGESSSYEEESDYFYCNFFVVDDGKTTITITAEDDNGITRGVYYDLIVVNGKVIIWEQGEI